jgi:hypothetical protein
MQSESKIIARDKQSEDDAMLGMISFICVKIVFVA